MSNAGDTETGENSGSPGHLTQHRNMSRIGSPSPLRRARMPSKGLRGGLEVAEGVREVTDTDLWITLVSALGSLNIGARIGAVGTHLLRERAREDCRRH
jgi:hypothetical protein